jgi:hypothetical protein
MWQYSGDVTSTLAAVFALSHPANSLSRLPLPPSYQLPTGDLRDITPTKGDVAR